MLTSYLLGLLLPVSIRLPSFSLTGAMSPALPALSKMPASLFRSAGKLIVPYSAEELCDELLAHMLDCDVCLRGGEHTCSAYQWFQQWIAFRGAPRYGVIFAL